MSLNEYITFKIGEEYGKYHYDDIYYISIDKYETFFKPYLEKGYLFEKYNTIALYSYIKEGDVILDIGANIGFLSIPLSRAKENVEVYSFEPFQKTFNLLQMNIIQNECKNITPLNIAIGHTNMFTTMSDIIIEESPNTNFKKKNKNIIKNKNIALGSISIGEGSIPIMMKTIDSFNFKKVNIIKVDVEGAEPLVFYGAQETIKKFKPIILFEKNTRTLNENYLKKIGASSAVKNFNIITFCKKLGYHTIIEMNNEDYLLLPPNAKKTIDDPNFKYKYVTDLSNFNNNSFKNMNLYKYIKPKWNKTQWWINLNKKFEKDINNKNIDISSYSSYTHDPVTSLSYVCIYLLYVLQQLSVSNKIKFNLSEIKEQKNIFVIDLYYSTGYIKKPSFPFKYNSYNVTKNIFFFKDNIRNRLEEVEPEYIVSIINKYNLQNNIDLLTIIGFHRYYFLKKILDSEIYPNLINVIYNPQYLFDNKVINYNSKNKFIYTDYVSSSISVYYELLKKHDYSLIGSTNNGVWLYFIRNKFLSKKINIVNINDIYKLYKKPVFGPQLKGYVKNKTDRKILTKKEANIVSNSLTNKKYKKLILKEAEKLIKHDIKLSKIDKNIIYNNIYKYEYNVFTKNGEDGIISALLNTFNSYTKYFVEINPTNLGTMNSRFLYEYKDWDGVFFNNYFTSNHINFYKEYVTPKSVLSLFKKYNIPKNIGLLSFLKNIDIYNTLIEILKVYSSNIIICPYAKENSIFTINYINYKKIVILLKEYQYRIIYYNTNYIFFIKLLDE